MYLTAIVMITALFSSLFQGCNQGPVAEPEVHLIPAGFIGQVTIHHNRADGVEPVVENGARVYRIPADGTLYTRQAPNHGVREPAKMKFFYVAPETGQRELLPVSRQGKGAPPDVVSILGGYQVGPDFHYFVDQPRNEGTYKNPAIEGGERQWQPGSTGRR